MKLKRILAGILTGAMIISGIPALGIDGAAQIWAETTSDPVDSTGEDEHPEDALYSNIAENKPVTVTGTDGVNGGANAVDGDTETFWTSKSISTNGAQSLTIDLGSSIANIGAIKVKFNGKAWSPSYDIETRTSGSGSTWSIVKEVRETDKEINGCEHRIDTNQTNETIVLSRYVRFTFNSLSAHAGSGVTGVSVAEITILGKDDGIIYGPKIALKTPVTGQYPEPAEVKSAVGAEGNVYHTNVADRTLPRATLIEQGTGTKGTEDRPVGPAGEAVTTQAPKWEDGKLLSEAAGNVKVKKDAENGVYGFNVLGQTPGTRNKFDIYGTDINIISFQLYLDTMPVGTGADAWYILGKGTKYYVEADSGKLALTMRVGNNNANGKTAPDGTAGTGKVWLEEDYVFTANQKNPEHEDYFAGKWHDILVVIDGQGSMRMYVDGRAAAPENNNKKGIAISDEVADQVLAPFAIGAQVDQDGTAAKPFRKKVDGQYTDEAAGYIARLKFYTNKEFEGIVNGANRDISNATVLSDQFDGFQIKKLEATERDSQGYYAVTNMIQKEDPTLRITLCPYGRTTTWQKLNDQDEWVDMGVTETFAADGKYKATTKLTADVGYAFSEETRERVAASVLENNPEALSTVILSNKNRVITSISYFGLSDDDKADKDIVGEECGIESVLFEEDEITLTVGEDAIALPKPVVTKHYCPSHSANASEDEIEYIITEGNEYIEISDGKIKGVKTTANVLGNAAVIVKAKVTLKSNGQNVTNADGEPITAEAVFHVTVNNREQVIVTAPAITMVSPVKGQYPQVAEIRRAEESLHHDDIADRMQPSATFVSTDDDAVTGENQLPADQQIPEAVIKYVDGIWAYNAQAQTLGTDNKFDVGGHDVKVISFKFYPTKKPQSGDANRMSLFGKGNKYSIQIDSDKLFLFANVEGNKWAEEAYYFNTNQNPNYPGDAEFFGKWHDMFLVVDGKGKQRLYVDGNPSKTTKDFPAYALEVPTGGKKPFSIGCNLGDTNNNAPIWWTLKFTEEYGYLADFEFYTNKDYTGVINAAGTSVEDAAIISESLANDIDIAALEREHSGNLNAVITNLLQQSNPAVNISVNPYTAKTIWRQRKAGTTDEYEEPKPMEKFGASSVYQSEVILTAHTGFKFDNSEEFKSKVKAGFKSTSDLLVQDSIKVTVEPDNQGNEQKVLRITAQYSETAEADCTCAIGSVTAPSPVSVVIPAGEDEAVQSVTPMAQSDVALAACEKPGHPIAVDDVNARIHYTYEVVDAASVDALELTKNGDEIQSVKAKKAGDFKIQIKAEYQTKDGDAWKTVENTAGSKAEKLINLVVNVRRADQADAADQDDLKDLAEDIADMYPDSASGDYNTEAWVRLQAAIADAIAKANKNDLNIIAGDVEAALKELEAAAAAMANNKSAQGIARDELMKVLADLEEAYVGDNEDKKYTEESWKLFTDAYEAASGKVSTANETVLKNLKEDLETKYGELVPAEPIKTPDNEPTVKDGEELTGADGTKYQVASAKDKTVIITKGIDVKTVKVGPTVVINKETYKVIGIGNGAFKGLKKATKVVINANVAAIGDQAFANSKKLKNVTIGADVTKIGKKAFFKCSKLNKVILKGKGLTSKSIGKKAFGKTAKKATVKWGKVKGKQRTQLKKAIKKAGLKVK